MNEVMTKELTGSQILIESLKKEGVDTVFGYPGGAVLSIYEQLYHTKDIKHYLVRHEQGAIHAAEGYARVTDKCGVAVVTSGPGATNIVTGVANAYLDGYPLVVFTGQVGANLIGNDAFQEADILGITRSCTKHNYLVKDAKDLAQTIKEAFYIANTGKKGPVVVDLAKNILDQKVEFEYPKEVYLEGYNPTYKGNPKQISKALQLLCSAKRPVIIAGGGVLSSNASRELTELSKFLNIPVATTLMGVGVYPMDDEQSLGMLGMHGNYWANYAICECDVLFAIGTRFNDRATGPLSRFAKDAQIIHVDIDPCSISKNVPAHIPIVGDAGIILQDMLNELKAQNYEINKEVKHKWLEKIEKWKEKRVIPEIQSEKLHAHMVLERIAEYTKPYDPVIATEVGQHQMWTVQAFNFTHPRRLVTSGGLGTMGFGFPAAMGAGVADKNRLVINIAGDGSIQMNIQELATCVEYNLPVKVVIMNNGYLGMVRQWQEKLYHKHYSYTKISGPDFVKVAEAYGAKGIRVEREDEIIPALKAAIEYPGPVFLDFILEPFETVYPWVLAGKPMHEVLLSSKEDY
ncbi:MAG: biosynthetic-type acetolactate synthase large subunit [Candidatus Gastranaerophilales bacterium]|nr:biosynthetic-type acetolactate synthase large subunit [Candidatus Gastranaerophilales bacterium]